MCVRTFLTLVARGRQDGGAVGIHLALDLTVSAHQRHPKRSSHRVQVRTHLLDRPQEQHCKQNSHSLIQCRNNTTNTMSHSLIQHKNNSTNTMSHSLIHRRNNTRNTMCHSLIHRRNNTTNTTVTP